MKRRDFLGSAVLAILLAVAFFVSAEDCKRILCYGDTITAEGGWVKTVGNKKAFQTINTGRSGRRTAQAVSAYLDSQGKSSANSYGPAPKGWPAEIKTVHYQASIDKTQQPMLVYAAKSKDKRPLLVGLHTWSSNCTQAGGEVAYFRWCRKKDWHFIHPDFRGPNWTPDACGSDKVVQDIVDAVEYMKRNYSVDEQRIYLVGASGGGYASLLLAGRKPDIWAGVSAWVPISDIRAWWETKSRQKSRYAIDIEKAVGGKPDQDENAAQECVRRSTSDLSRQCSRG